MPDPAAPEYPPRCLILDTETTGLDVAKGHRIIEICLIELIDRRPTGRRYLQRFNPERPVSADAFAIHGIGDDDLAGEPTFAACADEIVAFIDKAPLIAHNAAFDAGFINAELARAAKPRIADDRLICTYMLARFRHGMASASLDAVCKRYGIDTTKRTKHGAALDAELLVEVFLAMTGGRQDQLFTAAAPAAPAAPIFTTTASDAPALTRVAASPEEQALHDALLTQLTDPIWRSNDSPRP
jgi:DNA polymerase-3 subunit epsilon